MTIEPHHPQNLSQNPLGPKLPVGIPRKYILYSQNLTFSYIPTRLFFETKPQNLHKSLETIDLSKNVEMLAIQSDPDIQLIEDLGEDFQNHMEGRIALFLQQMLLLYKTKIPLDDYKQADYQVGHVPKKCTQSPQKSKGSLYVGAHSSTLPTLRIANAERNNTSVSLGYHTFFYYAWNATTYLPFIANHVDSEIDNTLRDIAINILNDVSLGRLNPKQGMHQFLAKLVEIIQKLQKSQELQELQEVQKREKKQSILRQYHSVADFYHKNVSYIIKKLCIKPINQEIDETFYMQIQEPMHKQLLKELQNPETAQSPDVSTTDISLVRNELESEAYFLSSTAQQYAALCIATPSVQEAACEYLLELQKLGSKSEIKAHLKEIQKITLSTKNLTEEVISELAEKFFQKALSTIQVLTKNPQSMGLILLEVLFHVCREFFPQPVITDESDKKAKLKEQLNNFINLEKEEAKERAEQLLSILAKEDIYPLYKELLCTSEKARAVDLEKLRRITPAKRGTFALTKSALKCYNVVVQAIQNMTRKRTSPKDVGQTMFYLLRDYPFDSPQNTQR